MSGTATPRHSWQPLRKTYGSNEQICRRCRLEKIGRFDRGVHWTEWKRDGKYLTVDATPPLRVAVTSSSNEPRRAQRSLPAAFFREE